MGVQTDVLIADRDEASGIASTATPIPTWHGFTFNGFDHVHVCTLLSLLRTGSPHTAFEQDLRLIEPIAIGGEEGPVVVCIRPEQVAELAAVTRLDETEFEALAAAWAATDEFIGRSPAWVRELLRELGDLATLASVQSKWVMLRQSL